MRILECKRCGHQFYEDGVMKCPNCAAEGRKTFDAIFSSNLKRTDYALVVSKKKDTPPDGIKEKATGAGKIRYGLMTGRKANYLVIALICLLAATGFAARFLSGPKSSPPPPNPASASTLAHDEGSSAPVFRQPVQKREGSIELSIKEPRAFLLVEKKAWDNMTHQEKLLLCRTAMDFIAGRAEERKSKISFLTVRNKTTRETLAQATLGTGEIKIRK